MVTNQISRNKILTLNLMAMILSNLIQIIGLVTKRKLIFTPTLKLNHILLRRFTTIFQNRQTPRGYLM
jgi:hypothetical protein